jgi:hypothetical protein
VNLRAALGKSREKETMLTLFFRLQAEGSNLDTEIGLAIL